MNLEDNVVFAELHSDYEGWDLVNIWLIFDPCPLATHRMKLRVWVTYLSAMSVSFDQVPLIALKIWLPQSPLTIASNSSFYFIDPMKIYTSTLVVASKNRGFAHMREKSFINIWYDFKWRREVVGGNKWLLRKASCMSYMCCVCETYVGWEMDWFNLNLLSLCCCQRLCFLGFCHFSKKTWVLAARLGARNFTRALGYAKHPLSVAHAFADARFCRRTLLQTLAFADARFGRRTLSQTHASAVICS